MKTEKHELEMLSNRLKVNILSAVEDAITHESDWNKSISDLGLDSIDQVDLVILEIENDYSPISKENDLIDQTADMNIYQIIDHVKKFYTYKYGWQKYDRKSK